MKFLMNVGAEKAGTTWLWKYFDNHPDFISCGKEMNIIERDTFIPTFTKSHEFKKDLNVWFKHVASLDKPTGDFTHYEGSSENIFRMFKDKFEEIGVDVVPVYIMRDPISRAWSSWNMFCDFMDIHIRPAYSKIDPEKYAIIEKIYDGSGRLDFNLHPMSQLFVGSYLNPKYQNTIQTLDNVFDEPLYFFYEDFFNQENMDLICNRMNMSSMKLDPTPVNMGTNHNPAPKEFIEKICSTYTYKKNVKFVFERFENVPWNISDYEKI